MRTCVGCPRTASLTPDLNSAIAFPTRPGLVLVAFPPLNIVFLAARVLALVDNHVSCDPESPASSARGPAGERCKGRQCRTHEDPPLGHAQERQDVYPASSIQQLRTTGDPLPRDDHAGHQAPLRVRLCSHKSVAYPLTCSRRFLSTVIPLEIWDCPGDATLETLDAPLTQFQTMVFVIDIQVSRVCRCPPIYIRLRVLLP